MRTTSPSSGVRIVLLDINLEIRQQQSCTQFALRSTCSPIQRSKTFSVGSRNAPPPQTYTFSRGIWTPIFPGAHESAPRKASRSVIPFLQVLPLCSTHTDKQIDRQTDRLTDRLAQTTARATFVAIGRIYAMQATRARKRTAAYVLPELRTVNGSV